MRSTHAFAATVTVALLGAPGDALAGGCLPDLTASITSDVELVPRPLDGRTRVRFTVRIANDSACAAAGTVRLKPFLLPDVAPGTAGHGGPTDGTLLPVQDLHLALAAGAETSTVYEARAPRLPRAAYKAAVIVDSLAVVTEANERNNASRLAPAGVLDVPRRHVTIEAGYDLTAEVRNAPVTKMSGGAAHTLGTVCRPYPSIEIPSDDVWGHFLVADLDHGDVYSLVYDSVSGLVEKQWYALAWNDERDGLDRRVGVDYYWQAPSFLDVDGNPFVPPGRYQFLTIIDSHDLVREFDEANNLEVAPFVLTPLELAGTPNTWLVSTAGQDPAPVEVGFVNSYAATLGWRAEIAGAPWLAVAPGTGSLTIDASTKVELRASAAGLAPGKYETELRLVADGLEAFPVIVPVSFYVYDEAAPLLEVTPTTLDFVTAVGVHPPTQSFKIANPGAATLEWAAWQDVKWVTLVQPSGSGPAGYEENVEVIIHPEGLRAGGPYTAVVKVLSSAPGGEKLVRINLAVTPCDDDWDCVMGGTCDLATGICSGPEPCSAHEDCDPGRFCDPVELYCAASATCASPEDTTCESVSWTYRLGCDAARMTCEPEECEIDEECPGGSYCGTGGYCLMSSACASDDECIGWSEALVCDETRATCEPAPPCDGDAGCPIGAWCDEAAAKCWVSATCTTDVDCSWLGMTCDVGRTTCVP